MWFYILLLCLVIILLLIFIRRFILIRRVRRMPNDEKQQRLNVFLEPFGFTYNPVQDIISSTKDAWQRSFGYSYFYDENASLFRMIFDSEPIYFKYREKTWLLEFWKGQYGICTGAEIGLYHADRELSAYEYKTTKFEAASDGQMIKMKFQLYEGKQMLFAPTGRDWWLTGFLPGRFTQPYNLTMKACLFFPNEEMRKAFTHALVEKGYNSDTIYVHHRSVCFYFSEPFTPCPGNCKLKRIARIQRRNHLYTGLFRFISRPFTTTLDRVLYLRFWLPLSFSFLKKKTRKG